LGHFVRQLQAGVWGAWPWNGSTRAAYGLPASLLAIPPVPSTTTAADRAFFGNIQILRIISAFAILFVHLEAMFRVFGDPTRVVNVLRFGTDLFVIVAGFLSAHLLSGGRRSSGSYLVGRLIRIWPLYAIFTLLGFVCQHYLMHNHPVAWWQIPLDLSFVPYGVAPILYQTWTLELIMACSLVLAACLLVSRRPVELAAAIIVGMVLAGLYYHPASPFLAFYADPAFLDFALGVLIFRLPRGRPAWALAAICSGFLLIVVRPWDFPDVPRFIALSLPVGGLVWGVISLDTGKRRPFVEWIAKATYGIYLIHWFADAAAEKLVRDSGSPWLAVVLIVAVPLAVTAAALLVHAFVEDPITRRLTGGLGKIRLKGRGSPRPG
jgi:exopolysaccharide production protein ExoZ